MRRFIGHSIFLLAAVSAAWAAKRESLDLGHVRLDLPGPPSAILSGDLNADGHNDLIVVLAYTDIENIGTDRIENMVQITTVIPALFDRREIRVFLGGDDGSFDVASQPFPIPKSVLTIARAGASLLALTDDGVSAVSFREGPPATLALEPILSDPPVIAGSGTFFPRLEWIEDLDGDGEVDVLLPARDGLAVYLRREGRLAPEPVQRLALPGDRRADGRRTYPLPDLRDVDGDRILDLIAATGLHRHVFLGNGDGTFRPAYPGRTDCPEAATALHLPGASAETLKQVVFVGDLDGSGRAEVVLQEEIEPEKSGFRAGLKQFKKPRQRFRLFRLDEQVGLEPDPYLELEAIGHSFSADLPTGSHQQFQDLDGDGRLDLIAVTLDFSILQVIKIAATKRIGIGLDFHVWAQQPDGTFREVEGLDLSEKLKLDLRRITIGRLAQFAGDFDGDGRADFVHFGRGRTVTIHRGQPGCRYPRNPDLSVELEQAPEDLGLIRVQDFDGDGRSDFSVVHPLEPERADVSPPVVLDLYLSGAAR